MKVQFAFLLETGIDLRRSAPTDTHEKTQEFALLSFFIAESYAMIMRVISKSIPVTSFLGERFKESINEKQKMYRTFFITTRELKISVGFKIGTAVIALIDLNWSNYEEQSSNCTAKSNKNVRERYNNVIGKKQCCYSILLFLTIFQ